MDDIHKILFDLIIEGTWDEYNEAQLARYLRDQTNENGSPRFVNFEGRQPSERTFYRIVKSFTDRGAEAFKSKLRPHVMQQLAVAVKKQASKNPAMLKTVTDIVMPTPQKVDINVNTTVNAPILDTIFERLGLGGAVSGRQRQASIGMAEGEIIEGDCPQEEGHVAVGLDDSDAGRAPAPATLSLGCGTDLFEGNSEGDALPPPPGDAQDNGDNGGGNDLRPADGPKLCTPPE